VHRCLCTTVSLAMAGLLPIACGPAAPTPSAVPPIATYVPTPMPSPAPTIAPALPPPADSGLIAFVSIRDYLGETHWVIMVMDADSSNARQPTDSGGCDGAPHWSPDGTQIA
jgi:hypothetical protein